MRVFFVFFYYYYYFHISEMSMFCRNSELNANSMDPDQMPRSAASYLGLHYLPMSLLWTLSLNVLTKSCLRTCANCTDSDSSCACGNSHPGVCSPSIHSIISNDFVSGL